MKDALTLQALKEIQQKLPSVCIALETMAEGEKLKVGAGTGAGLCSQEQVTES